MIKFIFLSLLIIVDFSSTSQTLSDNEKQIMKTHIKYISENMCYDIDSSLPWNCLFYSSDSCCESFVFGSERNDSAWSISFIYNHIQDLNYSKEVKYKFLEYSESYCLRDSIYTLKKETCNDTSMFFVYPKSNKYEKNFLIGKYTYLFERAELSPKQMNYYLKYRDSLMYVKGNDLPPLPEIDLVEDQYTMNLYILQGKDFYNPNIHGGKRNK